MALYVARVLHYLTSVLMTTGAISARRWPNEIEWSTVQAPRHVRPCDHRTFPASFE